VSSFTEPLTVTKIGTRTWQVEREFTYYIGQENSNNFIVVPKGFITDFASIPFIFWSILPPDGEYTQAAVLHDYCCSHGWLKSTADFIFYEAMGVLGVPSWKKSVMFFAVRLFHLFQK
jgi:hypothetical protein